MSRRRQLRIVCLGGGTGLSTLLRGLKTVGAQITAIVTLTDDGGSSGRLRRDLAMPPPGDPHAKARPQSERAFLMHVLTGVSCRRRRRRSR